MSDFGAGRGGGGEEDGAGGSEEADGARADVGDLGPEDLAFEDEGEGEVEGVMAGWCC